jgi:glutathione peroxidase
VIESIYDCAVVGLDGSAQMMRRFEGQVLLIVNTASKCGFTSQYEGLERLHRRYTQTSFSVLGFPCNQFNRQEPGNAAEIAAFCSLRYDVTFPLFAKIDVNGPQTHPVYRVLKRGARGMLGTQSVKWNFTKFLVDQGGQVLRRFAPSAEPGDLERHIEAIL